MNEIEVPELVGKVITSAKLLSTRKDEQELSLVFSDGTSFAFSVSAKLSAQAILFQGGVGEPATIRAIELPSNSYPAHVGTTHPSLHSPRQYSRTE